jgi:hypothetical protein
MTDHGSANHQHETSDISFRTIRLSVIVFIVAAVIIHLGVWWLFQQFRNVDQRRDVRRTLVEAPSPVPPPPRLQINPERDWQSFRQAEQQILDSYEWVSRDEGMVRIPIQRAMDLLVERGVPVRPSESQEKR